MKGPLDRTKVVLRHLPPEISQSLLFEQIDAAYSGRYIWVSFRPGKYSTKQPCYSRAYIDFKRPEDVIEFAHFFDGHVFVNEKGSQYKTIVEYAPSQRVPKESSKKDGREGTISKDSEYLEFLEAISKPVENLPSAEIQLERREAERAGAAKEPPIVTPLMDFVRKKRVAKSESRRSLSNGKLGRRAGGALVSNSSPASSRRGSDKRKSSSTVRYVLRDAIKNTSGKDKSTYTLVAKQNDQQISDKSVSSAAASRTEGLEENSGVPIITDSGKKKVLLPKGKEKETSDTMDVILKADKVVKSIDYPCTSSNIDELQHVMSLAKNLTGSVKQTQQREGSGRIIRTILLNKDPRRNQTEQQVQSLKSEEKRPPCPPHSQFFSKDINGAPEDKGNRNDGHGYFNDKHEKRTRNRDKPDRGAWNLRRSNGSYASDESLSSSAPHPTHLSSKSFEGSHTQVSRRGPAHGVKDSDGSFFNNDVKIKRGGPTHGSLEKQVWLQKSSSGT